VLFFKILIVIIQLNFIYIIKYQFILMNTDILLGIIIILIDLILYLSNDDLFNYLFFM